MLTRWSDLGMDGFGRNVGLLDELRRSMDRALDGYEWGPRRVHPVYERSPLSRLTVRDTGPAFVIRAEIPGFSEKTVNITVEQNTVTIHGERDGEAKEGASQAEERDAVRFSKSISLPGRIDAAKAEAVIQHGVLELTVPKVEEEKPRQIPIRAS